MQALSRATPKSPAKREVPQDGDVGGRGRAGPPESVKPAAAPIPGVLASLRAVHREPFPKRGGRSPPPKRFAQRSAARLASSVQFWSAPAQTRSNMARAWPKSDKLGRHGHSFQLRPMLVDFGPRLVELCQCRQASAQNWSSSAMCWPKPAHSGRNRLNRYPPSLLDIGPTLAELGPMLANVAPNLAGPQLLHNVLQGYEGSISQSLRPPLSAPLGKCGYGAIRRICAVAMSQP